MRSGDGFLPLKMLSLGDMIATGLASGIISESYVATSSQALDFYESLDGESCRTQGQYLVDMQLKLERALSPKAVRQKYEYNPPALRNSNVTKPTSSTLRGVVISERSSSKSGPSTPRRSSSRIASSGSNCSPVDESTDCKRR